MCTEPASLWVTYNYQFKLDTQWQMSWPLEINGFPRVVPPEDLGTESASSLNNAPHLFSPLPQPEAYLVLESRITHAASIHLKSLGQKPLSLSLKSLLSLPKQMTQSWGKKKASREQVGKHRGRDTIQLEFSLCPMTFPQRSTAINFPCKPTREWNGYKYVAGVQQRIQEFLWLCWLWISHTYNNKFLAFLAHMFEQCVAISLTVGDISFAVSKIHTEAVCPMKKLTSWVPVFAISHHLCLYTKKYSPNTYSVFSPSRHKDESKAVPAPQRTIHVSK